MGTWDGIHIETSSMKYALKVSYNVICIVLISLKLNQPDGIGSMTILRRSLKSAIVQI